jgi:hypothetical protein
MTDNNMVGTFIHVLYAEEGPESDVVNVDVTPGDSEAVQFYLNAHEARELGIGLLVAADRMEPSDSADSDEEGFGVHRMVHALTEKEQLTL